MYLFVYFFIFRASTFQLLDKPWPQVSSLLPPGSCLQFLSRIGSSNPTARRFSIRDVANSRSYCAFRKSICAQEKVHTNDSIERLKWLGTSGQQSCTAALPRSMRHAFFSFQYFLISLSLDFCISFVVLVCCRRAAPPWKNGTNMYSETQQRGKKNKRTWYDTSVSSFLTFDKKKKNRGRFKGTSSSTISGLLVL